MKKPMIWTRQVVVWSLFCALTVSAANSGLVLHLPFDGNVEAAVGQEVGVVHAEGEPAFVAGRFGQAISLMDGARLVVPLPPAIKQGEFTIAFWMKPLWHASDNLPHPILEIPDAPENSDKVGWAPGQYLLSKGWSESIAPNNLYGAIGTTAKNHLRPNQWTHVVISSSLTNAFTATYFNGEGLRRPSKSDKPMTTAHGNTMYFGRRARGKGIGDYGIGNFVLDDLKVFDRVVPPEELSAIAGETFPPAHDTAMFGGACDLDQAVETPHVVWAKPLAGGPLKVLCVGSVDHSREFIELTQRIELDPTFVVSPSFDARFMANPEFAAKVAHTVEQNLQSARPDVVVIADYGWNLLPETTRDAIMTFVDQGGGLLMVDPRCVSIGPGPGIYHWKQASTWYGWTDTKLGEAIEQQLGRLDRIDEEYLTQGIPFAALPEFGGMLSSRSPASAFRGGTVGKGRVLIYDMRFSAFSLTPALPSGVLFDAFTYDYAIGAVAKAVLWAGRRDGHTRIHQVSYRVKNGIGDRIRVGASGAWVIEIWNASTQTVSAGVNLTSRKNSPEVPIEMKQTAGLRPGLTQLTLKQPMTGIGDVFGDVQLLVNGEVVDWASGVVSVERSNPSFISLLSDAEVYEKGQVPQITGEVAFRKYAVKAGETGEIHWRLYDGYGRLVRRGMEPVVFDAQDEVTSRLVWPIGELSGANLGYTLVADLVRKGKISDQRSLDLWRVAPNDNDFTFFSWSGYEGSCKALATLVMRDRYHMRSGMSGRVSQPTDSSFKGQLAWLAHNNLRGWIYATTIGVNYHNHPPEDINGIRRPDLADPSYQKGLRDYLAKVATVAKPFSPFFYSLGDETSVGPPTMEASHYEQDAFNEHLRIRYKAVSDLNDAWGTSYASWNEVVIPSSEVMQAGTGGVVTVALQAFRETLYAKTLGTGLEGARTGDPSAYVGVEGIFGLGHAWMGQDYWKMTRYGNLVGMYDNSIMGTSAMQYNMVRSFIDPDGLFGCWWNYNMQDPDYSRYGPWHALLHGMNAFGWYTTIGGTYSALNADFSPNEQFLWTYEELEPLLTGLGKLTMGLTRDNLGLAVLHNQLNLDRNTPRFHAALMLTMMLDDLGLQYDFIHSDQVVAGELLSRNIKVLVLPGQTIMEPEVAKAIHTFVAEGGAVIADVQPATGNGFKRYEKPLLNELFADAASLKGGMPPVSREDLSDWKSTRQKNFQRGQTLFFNSYPTTYNWDRLHPRGVFMRDAVHAFLLARGLQPAASVRTVDGTFQPLTRVTYHDGDALYVGVQREYIVADQSPREFVFAVPSAAHAYDVRAGKYLGLTDRAKLMLEVARGAMVAFLPYEAKSIRLEGLPATCLPGTVISVTATLMSEGGAPKQGVFRVEVNGPDGKRVPALCSTPRWRGGQATLVMPMAFNDPLGEWRLNIVDVATGVKTEGIFKLE